MSPVIPVVDKFASKYAGMLLSEDALANVLYQFLDEVRAAEDNPQGA